MAGELGGKLSSLHVCVSGDGDEGGPVSAHDIVGDIGHICLQDVTEKDIDYACSLLFNKDTGLVVFLKKTVTHDEYSACKSELLELILAFMEKHEKKLVPYAVDIKDVCVSLFTRDRMSKTKNNAVAVLTEVIRQTSGSNMSDELGVPKMIEKFFLELTRPSKLTATSKQQLFQLLGTFAESFPDKMVNHADKLLDIYLKTLKTEMTSKTRKPEFTVIAGCIRGLTRLLVHFTQSVEEGSPHSYEIFKYARNTIDPSLNLTRFEMPRAGLSLFARHAVQFNKYLIDDHEAMYERLSYWSTHRNTNVLHDGMAALQEFLKQMAETLGEQSKKGGKADMQAFKFFIKKFRAIMDNPESTNKEISLAIKGYGYFAAPCKMFMSTDDVQFMFNEMMQRSEQIYLNQSEGSVEDKLVSLPSFLEALASIVTQLDDISDTFLLSLERLVVLLVEHFPKLSKKLYYMCFLAILKIYFSLNHKGAAFRGFLSRTVYHSVIRTCSHPVVLETEGQLDNADPEELAEQNKQKISYRDYIEFWTILLNSTSVKELAVMEISLEERQAFTEALYDELISSILKILERLDLTSNKSEENNTESEDVAGPSGDADTSIDLSSDPVSGLQASKPKDFIIFINLVDFSRDLLPHKQTPMFERWIYSFGHQIILMSTKFPLVSGFYKLLAVCMKICTKLQYFKGMGETGSVYSKIEPDSMEESSEPSKAVIMEEASQRAQREACFLLFNKFTKEVMQRLKQYKDDLLAACLTFILSLPQEVVVSQIVAIVPALKTTFEMGRSYLPLANAGLDAVEHWSATLPPHVFSPYYPDILPCLDAYLRTSTDSGQTTKTVSLVSSSSSKRSGKRRIPVKLLKSDKSDKAQLESQLSAVQKRCVRLLGTLGGSVNKSLIQTSSQEISKVAVAWDSQKHLKFDFPFVDIKPTIYFDPFLPRVIELSLTSSDRQTKVAASELLHSIVLYMLGRGAQKPGARGRARTESTTMEPLWRKVFPAIMKLACDVEQVCKQLFMPLMEQMIHWFSSSKAYDNPETSALIDTFTDCIESPTDTAVRDFSAKCIKDFLHWNIKQTSRKEFKKSQPLVKALLARIRNLARHPSSFKRLGAALAFNNMYTVFREEETLVDVFAFELLFIFIESLSLAHADDKSLGTAEHCKQSVFHLERIIRVKSKLFLKESELRKKPKELTTRDLQTLVKWLLRQCGRPQTECRHACMELVCKLSPSLDGVSKPMDFFAQILTLPKFGPGYFIQRFEGGLYKSGGTTKQGITKRPSLGRMSDTFTLKTTVAWFDLLLASVDCYIFFFQQGLLSPTQIFKDHGKGSSVLFSVIQYFITTLARSDLSVAAKEFKQGPASEIFTPREHDEYNSAKCTVIVRILDFLTILMGRHAKDAVQVIPSTFWNDALWETILLCTLEPTAIGFNMGDVEVIDNLPPRLSQLLMILNRTLPREHTHGLTKQLKITIGTGGKCNLFSELPETLSESSPAFLKLTHMVHGYELLYKSRILQLVDRTAGKDWAEKLLRPVFESLSVKVDRKATINSLTPTAQSLNERILQLVFSLDIPDATVIRYLLDKSPLANPGSSTTSTHGSIFYATFKSTINSHLNTKPKEFIHELVNHAVKEWNIVGNVLMGMTDQIGRDKDRELRKKQGPVIVECLLSRWKALQVWWTGGIATQETKTLTLGIFTKMVLIDSKVFKDGKHQAFPDILSMYLSLLTDSTTPLSFKSRILDLLPVFAEIPAADIKKLKSSLDRFIADNFPIESTEYPVGTPKFTDYITALNKLLNALEIFGYCGNLMMLDIIISIMCKEAKHVHEDDIQDAIARFIKRLPQDKQKLALDVPYEIFRTEDGYKNEQRRAALERVCLSMLRLVRNAALKEFFMVHITDIKSIIEAKQAKGSDSALETQVTTKLCCYQLVEVMYSRLKKDEVNSKDSSINSRFASGKVEKGNEMSTFFIKAASATKSENMKGETVALELRRQLHCAAYNALIAVISCTQTEEKFYTGFLFKDNVTKGQLLWDNLLDLDKPYEFPVEMEKPMIRKKKFVSIRNEVRETRRDDEDEIYTPVHYLASQYLADSSLRGDISQFDFGSSHASIFGSSGGASSSVDGSIREGSLRLRRVSSAGSSKGEMEAAVTVEDDYVEMEMDELNQHECMASLTALLQHMKRNKIIADVPKGETPDKLPNWMEMIREKIVEPSTPKNVKLFLAKVIVNTEEVFRPYARLWLSPIVAMVVKGDLGTAGIHYFMTDICVTLLSWHTVAIPEDNTVDRAMAGRLVEFLMSHCQHENRQVLKNNLEMIKTLVEVWRDRIEVPTRVLHDNFCDPDPKSKKNLTGIQLVGVILANKLNPFVRNTAVDKDRFYKHLAINMNSPMKEVHQSSAEVVGMAVKHMAETEKSAEAKEWREAYVDNISKMLMNFQVSKPDQFINCVYKMQIHYKELADRFLPKVLFMLPKVFGEYKTRCLEIVLNGVDAIDGVFTEMKAKGILNILSHRDEPAQHAALKVVHGMLRHLKAHEVLYLLPTVSSFSSSSSSLCRKVMYDIFMWIYDNYRNDDSDDGDKILIATKECLLQGLSDEDMTLKLTVQNFWSHETRLPTGTLDRLVAMLEAMYSPGTESQYLSYATNLLLEMTSQSPDFNRDVVEYPLSECKLTDYNVSSSWRKRHAAMTPLFVETQQTQAPGSTQSSDDTSMDSYSTGEIRATQDVLQFSATQGGSNAPYNWLTQSSLDTQNMDMSMSMTTETQSSLLFTVGSRVKPSSKSGDRKVGPGFGKERMGKKDTTDGQESSQASEIMRLKRRFVKDQESTKKYFLIKNARIKKIRADVQREQKQRREHQVTMYRKYRQGDLPDIQIKYSYLIAPLQALAQKDGVIARTLFSSIFKAIFTQIEDIKNERETRETIEKISKCLNQMISDSTQYFPPFIGCIIDMAIDNQKKIELDASHLNTACLLSLQQPLGIVLLEETITRKISEEDAVIPRKRHKGPGGDASRVNKGLLSLWVELARLYKSLGDYDMLRGIFGHESIGTVKSTRTAMEEEMRCDYAAALKTYKEALDENNWETQPDDVEQGLWEDGKLQCLENLGRWDKLATEVASFIDGEASTPKIEKVWDDTYSQEHFMPYMMKSHLKLIVTGDDKHLEEQQELLSFVDSSMKVTERKAFLESRYCEELALLYLSQDDYDRAKHYSEAAIANFLREWGGMDNLMFSSRSTYLQTLQKLTELQEFLQFIKREATTESIPQARRLIKRWSNRSPDPLMDPATIWDDVISNRCLYLEKIHGYLESVCTKMEVDGVEETEYNEDRISLRLSQATAANKQNNFSLALALLASTQKEAKADGSLLLRWSHTYAQTHCERSQINDPNFTFEKKIKALTGALDLMGNYGKQHTSTLDRNLTLKIAHNLLNSQCCKTLAQCLLNEISDPSELAHKYLENIKTHADCDSTDTDKLISSLYEKGFQYCKTAVSLSSGDRSDADDSDSNKAHIALLKFCDNVLRLNDEDEANIQCPSLSKFATAVVTSMLKAMKNNSIEARQRFPRLLQIVVTYPETRDTFIKLAKEVPCWMFISWINQMSALLDKPESPAVQDILLSIAETYPAALQYPFRLSKESYKFDSTLAGRKASDVHDRIWKLVSKNKEVDRLINALEQFGQPNELFRDWGTDLELCRLMAKPKANAAKIKEMFQEMYKQLVEPEDDEEDASLYSTQGTQSDASVEKMGPYFKKFATHFKKVIDTTFGRDGSKILGMTYKEFLQKQDKIYNDMKGMATNKHIPPGTLKEYSTYLSAYNDNRDVNPEAELEIPGQYHGLSKPLPEYHIYIAGFHQQVLVLSSIRKPKRLTIQGSDAKEHPFMVKGGEDLRQDQRIEQLFGIMNNILLQDPMCSQRKLNLRTYQVIPMTPRVGMIEWMNKTQTLKDFWNASCTEQERKYLESNSGPRHEHNRLMERAFAKTNKKEYNHKIAYGKGYEIYSRSDTLNAFKMRQNQVKWDLSIRAYKELAASTEAYFMLKSNFATSHAVLCICQWIVGIGDRHLSNFMIDKENGNVVGIDFGHAFGSATQFLPIPELMPFRMSRLIRNMASPLREKGTMENVMIHTLRALRSHSDLLLNTMDVFIKEPSLDWQNFALKQAKTMSGRNSEDNNDLEDDPKWYPKEKVSYARRKLDGWNPAYITRDELKLGHYSSPYYKYFIKVALGDPEFDVRATHSEKGLTVEQQVACLLNQATDGNILGRVWVGWESWM